MRSFNRTVTQRIGALNDRYLSRERSLGQARLLWEIGLEGCEVRALRRRLELDSGQTSRLLRSLEEENLVTVSPSPSDRRAGMARLTPSGVAERALLDHRSDELAASIIEPLSSEQRQTLGAAMETVERLLTLAQIELRPTPMTHPDARQCLRAYFAELDRRSESGFDPTTSPRISASEFDAPSGCFLLAYLREEPVACGGVRHRAGEPSEVKRMWVSETARGLGIGGRLLEWLEARARAAGARAVRLDTNQALVEAIGMYRSRGYVEVDPFNDDPYVDHWFEKHL